MESYQRFNSTILITEFTNIFGQDDPWKTSPVTVLFISSFLSEKLFIFHSYRKIRAVPRGSHVKITRVVKGLMTDSAG